MCSAQIAPTSIPVFAVLRPLGVFALLPFPCYRDATTRCPVPRSRSLSRAVSVVCSVALCPFLPALIMPGPPGSCSMTYLACLYPTGPPTTLWRGAEGPFRA